MNANTTVIRQPSTWIEGEAIQQLERTATLEGMSRVVGMPDLHPGKGSPIGAGFFSATHIHPYLVGSDIGCGIGLWQTDLNVAKLKLDRVQRRISDGSLEGPWEGDCAAWLAERGVECSGYEAALGTVGSGNHFAELLRVEELFGDVPVELGLDRKRALAMVHSGSRGLGHSILEDHVARFAAAGLRADSEDAQAYVRRHDAAVAWAAANRALVAHRLAQRVGCDVDAVLDIVHNSVSPTTLAGEAGWLHRKGAAPTDHGPVVIAGSRGTLSYVVIPTGDGELNARCLAHGAGRKWKRSEARARLRSRFKAEQLRQTALGGRVVCDDRDLLFEEAPEAYKSIETVIEALEAAGVARRVASLRPLLTYKVARR